MKNIVCILLCVGIIILNLFIILKVEKCCGGEKYVPPVTLSMPQWRNYVASGMNTLLGSGGVIHGGTEDLGWAGGGAVYKGHVRQGYGWGV